MVPKLSKRVINSIRCVPARTLLIPVLKYDARVEDGDKDPVFTHGYIPFTISALPPHQHHHQPSHFSFEI